MFQPKKFGPFVLNRLIGRGGMGAVYQATHETTGQTVAVKALLLPLEEERERFEAEIATLKLLRHENIVKLYGFGQEDGVLYYAMEFVPGPSLATLLKRGRRFTWEEAAYIGVAVSKALKHAHDRGVVHRDVKPANILILDDGVVKVSDYGIAQYFGSSRLTGANQIVGTIQYMAPEQAQAGPLTPRTDIYSLGALLYALLAGAPPYSAKTLPELLRRFREGAPESIRFSRPETPKVFDEFLRDLLQCSPEKRPRDANLVGRRLEGILLTASSLPGGNPFWRRRFSLDGESAVDSFGGVSENANSRIDLENPSALKLGASSFADSFVDGAAPDFPYRSVEELDGPLNDEKEDKNRERDAEIDASFSGNIGNAVENCPDADGVRRVVSISAFEQTTELDANADAATLRALPQPPQELGFDSFNLPTPNDATRTQGGFAADLADGGFELGDFATESGANAVSEAPQKSNENDAESENLALNGGSAANASIEKSVDALQTLGQDDDLNVQLVVETSEDDAEFSVNSNASAIGAPTPTVAAPAFQGSPNFSTETTAAASVASTVCQSAEDYLAEARRQDGQASKEVDEDGYPLVATPLEKFKKSRFIPVDEKELGNLPHTNVDETRPIFWIAQISGAVLALAAIVALFWAAFQTPSADSLYRRIEKKIAENREDEENSLAALRRAKDDLTRFAELYSTDPRAVEVRRRLTELELDDFEQRVERKIRRNSRVDASRPPIERAYVEAARVAKIDVDDGIQKLTAFVDLFDAPTTDGDLSENDDSDAAFAAQLVVVARRRLKRLQEEREEARRADLGLVADRLAAANALQKTDPERAEKIRAALATLYADKLWAREALEDARNDVETPENDASETVEKAEN